MSQLKNKIKTKKSKIKHIKPTDKKKQIEETNKSEKPQSRNSMFEEAKPLKNTNISKNKQKKILTKNPL